MLPSDRLGLHTYLQIQQLCELRKSSHFLEFQFLTKNMDNNILSKSVIRIKCNNTYRACTTMPDTKLTPNKCQLVFFVNILWLLRGQTTCPLLLLLGWYSVNICGFAEGR